MTYLRYAVFGLLLASAGPVVANEPLDPVKAIMTVATKETGSYFDPDALMALYTVAFTRDMVAAVLRYKEQDNEMLFDYDPVIGGQDHCPLKNVTYKQGPQKGNRLTVRVEFSAAYCMGTKGTSLVDFDLVQEGAAVPTPWYFIDDIRHVDKNGKTLISVRQELKEMATR